MKKGLFTLLLVFVATFNSFAQNQFESGGYVFSITSISNKTVSIESFNKDSIGTIIIPAKVTYNNHVYSVTDIGYYAFNHCSGLTSITIPENITNISFGSFSYCSNLTSITLSNTVTRIYAAAFEGCNNLNSITIPESVIYISSERTFSGCNQLKSITVSPENTIYDSRDNCNAIIEKATNTLVLGCVNTIIPKSVTSIGYGAFYGCKTLTSISIPDNVTSIGGRAFYDCSSLSSISIPESVIDIHYGAFWGSAWYKEQQDGLICIGKVAYEYKGTMPPNTSIVIPNGIKSISSSAFSDCKGLISITIPEGVTSIGNSTFRDCSNLVSILFPESITDIGTNSFDGTAWYENLPNGIIYIGKVAYKYKGIMPQNSSIVIPEGITTIGNNAFAECIGMTSLILPESINSIEFYAFSGCTGLTSISIPKNLSNIDEGAFAGCCNLTSISVSPENTIYDSRNNCNAIIESITNTLLMGCQNTTIPSDVTKIARGAFVDFKGLTITIPKNVSIIDNGAFTNCSKLTSITVSPDNSVYDSRYDCNAIIESKTNTLFLGCQNTVIPSNISKIGIGAFGGCIGLRTITIPESAITIDNNAFENCTSLESITIPEKVSFIGNSSFKNCCNLTSVRMMTERPDTIEINDPFGVYNLDGSLNNYQYLKECILYVPMRCCYLYKNMWPWSYFKDIRISEANKNCVNVDGINYIIKSTEDRTVSVVFGNYKGNLVIPPTVEINKIVYSVKTVDKEAFTANKQLLSVSLPDGLTSIGDYAFSSCDSLVTVYIPDGVTNIGLAFFECSGIQSLSLPFNITTIKDSAFYCCDNLVSINISENVTSIGKRAFFNCRSLASLILPSGITTIENNTFYGCSNLKSINIPSGVKKIKPYAFTDCKKLTTITIPNGVTTIGNGAFSGCESLSYVSLPPSAVQLGDSILSGCKSLKTAGPQNGGYNYEFSWDTIPSNAFINMNSLKEVYIPKTVRLIMPVCINGNYLNEWDVYYDNDGNPHELFLNPVFYHCDSLESLAVSFCETKLMRQWFWDNRNILPFPLDYRIYLDTPIKKITILDDTIKSLYSIELGEIEELCISEYTDMIYPSVFGGVTHTVNRITVDVNNSNYSSKDGFLFDKIGQKLWACPPAYIGSYSVPENTHEIVNSAFKKCKWLSSVTIPQSVYKIGEMAFENCNSLTEVTIKGAPEIGVNAFTGCPMINAVTSQSIIPGTMQQIIATGELESIINRNDNYLTVSPLYNEELGRNISKIDFSIDYSIGETAEIVTTNIPAGKYKVSIGLLPQELPNSIHPIIYGITDTSEVVLLDPIENVDLGGFVISIFKYYDNDILKYDSIVIADTLEIPSGYQKIKITIESYAYLTNPNYSRTMLLDRIFFEPIDSYTGPFNESVFSSATLYIPDGTVEKYRAAPGWKLFKNIAIDTSVKPFQHNNKNAYKGIIYDITGRKIEADSPDQLKPGIYIINGLKYLKR
ncbi:MAG: leucine-rich repeat protein [Bacteroidaceae bacterium]|nr:leucine-rich repeat protein [Bacteroidaceae bacterium]